MGKTVTFKGNPKQLIAIDYFNDDTTTEILFGGGAGGGKTYLGAFLCIMSCLRYEGSISIIGGKTLKKLKETVVPTLLVVLDKVFGMGPGKGFSYNAQTGIIRFKQNGSFILLKDLDFRPSDPEYQYIDGYTPTFGYIDEVSGVPKKAKDRFFGRIRYRHQEYGITTPKLLMTCNPSHGWLKTEFYDPFVKGELKESRKFIKSLATDNPRLAKSYIEKTLMQLPENLKRVYLHGDWEYYDDDLGLMKQEAINDAFYQNLPEDPTDKIMSVDIAGEGKDKTVALVFYGNKLKDCVVLDKNTPQELIKMVQDLALKHGIPNTRIVMDAVGIGFIAGMIRGVYQFKANYSAQHTNVTGKIYGNLKVQCFYKLAQMVNEKLIDLSLFTGDRRERVRRELLNIHRKEMNTDSALRLEGKMDLKKKIGHSPDYADALSMAMVFRLQEKRKMQPLSNYGFDIV